MKKNIYAVLLIVACAVNGSVYAMTLEEGWKVLSPDELVSKILEELPQFARENLERESFALTLFEAIPMGRADVLEYLLDRRGANPNAIHYEIGSILGFAIEEGNDQIMGILLEHGADPNFQYDEGNTLLHAVAASGDANVVNKLLQIGADPTIQDNLGETPYDVATGPAKQVLKDEMDKRAERMGEAILSVREKYKVPRDIEGEIARAGRKYHFKSK